jgi:hypothetical protein
MGLSAVARSLGAHRRGSNYYCDCPLNCGYTLSLASGENVDVLAFCHGGCSYDAIAAALVTYGLFDDWEGELNAAAVAPPPELLLRWMRVETARSAYNRLTPATGTLAERYYNSRGITLPLPSILRSGNVPHRLGGMLPAVAAPVVDIGGYMSGLHSTFLDPEAKQTSMIPSLSAAA